jgi:hypothetical protein
VLLLRERVSADSTIRPAFRIQVSTPAAFVVHPAREPTGEKAAQDEYSAEHDNCQKRVPEAFH